MGHVRQNPIASSKSEPATHITKSRSVIASLWIAPHGLDFKAAGTAKLANVCWQLGELERARELFDKAIARAVETGHSATIANAHGHKMIAETARGMVAAAQRNSDIVTEIAGKTGLAFYLAGGRLSQAWARARLGDHDAGVAELRQAAQEGKRAITPSRVLTEVLDMIDAGVFSPGEPDRFALLTQSLRRGELLRLIKLAGRTPVERDTLYRPVQRTETAFTVLV